MVCPRHFPATTHMDYIFGFILSGLIGAVCGQFKGRVVTGFILGLLLGPSANYQFFDANKGEWVSIYAHPALAPRRVSTNLRSTSPVLQKSSLHARPRVSHL